MFKIITATFIFLLCTSSIFAHPHNWIDLKSSFIVDKHSNLVQIKQQWTFDAYYSLMTHADILTEYGNEEKGLPATADRMINSLSNYHYFSTLVVDGKNIDIKIPKNYSLSTETQDDQLVLKLEMTFDIEPRISLKENNLTWQIYDPTYYIAMNHGDKSRIEVIAEQSASCGFVLEFPDTPDEFYQYAQSLDQNQTDTDGLGVKFAETTIIHCQ